MAIDIQTETVVSFREAAKYCPRRRRGRKPAISTFYRWREQGLETIRVGSQHCTSLQALQRFFDRLSGHEPRMSDHDARAPPSVAKQDRHQDRVEAELAKLGL